MKGYLIDTTPLAALASRRPAAVDRITPWMRPHEAATNIIVYGEVLEGLQSLSNYPERHAELLTLLAEITPYLDAHAVVQHCTTLRRQLCPPWGPGLIGDMGLSLTKGNRYGAIQAPALWVCAPRTQPR